MKNYLFFSMRRFTASRHQGRRIADRKTKTGKGHVVVIRHGKELSLHIVDELYQNDVIQ